MKDVCLSDAKRAFENPDEISDYLETFSLSLIQDIKQSASQIISNSVHYPNYPEDFKERIQNLQKLPLLRIRVDHTDFPKCNTSRFAQRLLTKIANPEDAILFKRPRIIPLKPLTLGAGGGKGGGNDLVHAQSLSRIPRNGIDSSELATVVSRNIRADLKLLSISKLNSSIRDFVEKQSTTSIESFVSFLLFSLILLID